jgi:hypothetical protein
MLLPDRVVAHEDVDIVLRYAHAVRYVDVDDKGFPHHPVHLVEKRRLAGIEVVEWADHLALFPADLEGSKRPHHRRDVLRATGIAASDAQ